MNAHVIKISVVMGSYNQRDTLAKVLEAYNNQIFEGDFEVIVVDSTSSDGTKEMLEQFKASFLFHPIIAENKGKAAARNRGVTEAKSDIIIITDSDMIPDTHFIKAHFDAHMAQPGKCFEGAAYNLPNYTLPPDPKSLIPQIGRHEDKQVKLGGGIF